MAEEMKQISEEYEVACMSDDAEKDKALIRLLEAKRNLGTPAVNGGKQFPLATNKAYQEAKKRSSMSI